MGFLLDKCSFSPLDEEVIAGCRPFSCGNADLDEHPAAFRVLKEDEKKKMDKTDLSVLHKHIKEVPTTMAVSLFCQLKTICNADIMMSNKDIKLP